MKDQLSSYEKDLGEFKDIYDRYTDQLIKVKVRGARKFRTYKANIIILTAPTQMSDMANNDLEKYAKALDR